MAPEGAATAPVELDATDAFAAHLEASEAPSEVPEEPRKKPPEPEQTEAAEPEPAEAPAEDEDPDVELPFGEETKTYKLRELRSLIEEHGQFSGRFAEAAKASEAATAQKDRLEAAYTEMWKRAEERYAPYKDLDWLAISRDPNVDPETFKQVRADAEAAYKDLAFLHSEVNGRLEETRKAAEDARHEAAKACAAELTDPVKGIKDFPAVYPKLVEFARKSGVEGIENVTDPTMLRLLHKAYLYDTGSKTVDAQVQKVVNKPSRVIKPGSAGSNADASEKDGLNKALKSLRANPTDSDAITAAFMAKLH